MRQDCAVTKADVRAQERRHSDTARARCMTGALLVLRAGAIWRAVENSGYDRDCWDMVEAPSDYRQEKFGMQTVQGTKVVER